MLIGGPPWSIATFSGWRGRFAVGETPAGAAAPPGDAAGAMPCIELRCPCTGVAGPAAAAPADAAPCIAAIAYQSSVDNEQGSRRESRGSPSSPGVQVRGYWIVRLGQTLRYHAQMVYRVCEMLRAFLKQPNLEPP